MLGWRIPMAFEYKAEENEQQFGRKQRQGHFNFCFIVLLLIYPIKKYTCQTIDLLSLPSGHLGWMNFVLGGNLLNSLVVAQCFERHTRFKLI